MHLVISNMYTAVQFNVVYMYCYTLIVCTYMYVLIALGYRLIVLRTLHEDSSEQHLLKFIFPVYPYACS